MQEGWNLVSRIRHYLINSNSGADGKPAIRPYPTYNPDHYNEALRHYSLAVADARKHITTHSSSSPSPTTSSSKIELVLISCIIFICFDILHGAYNQAATHLRIGVKILDEYVNANGVSSNREKGTIQLKQTPSTPIEIISHTFVALDYDLAMFGTLAPYLRATVRDQTVGFNSLDGARLHLNALTNTVHRMRAELEAVTGNRMRELGLETGDFDRDNCWMQISCSTIELDGHRGLQERIWETRRTVAAWSEAFARLPEPVGEEDVAAHTMLQVQFMVVSPFFSFYRLRSERLGCSEGKKRVLTVLRPGSSPPPGAPNTKNKPTPTSPSSPARSP